MNHSVVAAGIGFVVGAFFTPAVALTIKSWFVKEATAVEADVKADVKKVV